MGNQTSNVAADSDPKQQQEQQQQQAVAPIPKLAAPTVPFQDLSLSSFRVQELFAESRYCRYLRDIMTTLHHTPELLGKIQKENVQSLYALYWSCLLSTMDKELNESLPPTLVIDKMASELVMSRFDPKVETQLMKPIAKIHDKYFEKYEQFIDRHFEATQMTQSALDQPYLQMMERSSRENLDVKPRAPWSSTSSVGENDGDAINNKKEMEDIQSKYHQLVGEGKYCGPLPDMTTTTSGTPTNESVSLTTPQQFEQYYKYRMCVIAHMCSTQISNCMKEEKKGAVYCVHQSPSVQNNCIDRLVKSGIPL